MHTSEINQDSNMLGNNDELSHTSQKSSDVVLDYSANFGNALASMSEFIDQEALDCGEEGQEDIFSDEEDFVF